MELKTSEVHAVKLTMSSVCVCVNEQKGRGNEGMKEEW